MSVVNAPVIQGQFVGAAAEIPAAYRAAFGGSAFDEPVVEIPAARTAVDDEPAIDEHANEEPAIDEPADDEPATDEPAIDEPVVSVAAPLTGREPLLTAEAIEGLLKRWDDIQSSFVDGPGNSVQAADTLIQAIGATYEAALRERRNRLAEGWQGSSDTEQMRSALIQYRTLVGVLLPK